MKKYSTTINIIFFFWGLLLLAVSSFYPEYVRYYLYFSIIVIIPIMIIDLIKQRKKDKVEGTALFQASIYRMLIMAVVLGLFFFITQQNYV